MQKTTKQRWQQSEIDQLHQGIIIYKRDFSLIQQNMFPDRTVQSIRNKIYQIDANLSELSRSISPIVSTEEKIQQHSNLTMDRLFLLNQHGGYHIGWSKIFTESGQ